MNKLPKVSVVMSNYNGLDLRLIDKSLPSILKNSYPNLEVLLVDNASVDKSLEYVKKNFRNNPKLRIIENPVNMYSVGLNLGIKNSIGKYVAFFNNDAYVEDGYFEKFVSFLDKNSSVALAQGKLLSSVDHSKIDCVGETMDIFGNPLSFGHGDKDSEKFNSTKEILSVSGSCSILRKSVVKKIGNFDEAYGIGYEDMDLSLRAWMNDLKVIYFPDVRVFHKRGATDLSPVIRNKVKWHFNKNRIATLIKNEPSNYLILSLPVVFVFYILMGIYESLIQGKPKLGLARLTSIIWVIYHLPELLSKRRKLGKRINNFGKIKNLMIKKFVII